MTAAHLGDQYIEYGLQYGPVFFESCVKVDAYLFEVKLYKYYAGI